MDLCNHTDTAYRTPLRGLNNLSYVRYEAKLVQLEANIDRRFAEQDAKWERTIQELDWERQIRESDMRVDGIFDQLCAELDKLIAIVEARPAAIQASLLMWMVVLWATTILAIVGIG